MSPAPSPAPVQARAPDIARRIGFIVAGLAALVAHRFLRDPRLQSLIVPLWTRLTGTAARFDRLMTRLATNGLQEPRPPRPHRPKPNPGRPNPFPTVPGWLIRALPHEAAAYAAQLEALLTEPATADLLAACPTAGHILRPLARMLGLRALAAKRTAPMRNAQNPDTQAEPHRTAQPPPPARTSTPPRPQSPHRSGTEWPTAYRPSANWPAACRRRPAPA